MLVFYREAFNVWWCDDSSMCRDIFLSLCSFQESRFINQYSQLVYVELRHLDIRHFVNEECRRLSNGCTAKCGCICHRPTDAAFVAV